MSTRRIVVALCVVLGPRLLWAQSMSPPSNDTQQLLDDHPGLQALIQGNKVVALYGVPFAVNDGDPPKSVEQFVHDWLFEGDFNGKQGHKDALGVAGVELVFRDSIMTGDGRFQIIRYDQYYDELLGENGLVTIAVLLGSPDKIGYIGISLLPAAALGLPTENEITAAAAIEIVAGLDAFAHLTFGEATKVVAYDTKDEMLHRVWSFEGIGDSEAYRFYVDTTSTKIVGIADMVFHDNVTVTVIGNTTPCCHPESDDWPACCCSPSDLEYPNCDPCCCLPDDPAYPACAYDCCASDNPDNEQSYPVQRRISGVEVRAMDEELEVDADYTDDAGQHTFQDLTDYTGFESLLDGTRVLVRNDADDPLAATLTSMDEDEAELTFNELPEPPDWPDPLLTAQVNAFVAVQKTNAWFAELQPDFSGMDRSIDCHVNVHRGECVVTSCHCNAFYIASEESPKIECRIPSSPIGTCQNSAFSTIVAHEYGHFILEERTPVRYFGDYPLPDGAFKEGFADTVTALLWQTECFGADWLADTTCVRNIDSLGKTEDHEGFTTANCPPDGCEVQLGDARCASWHCSGLAMAGAFWDLRRSLLYCTDSEITCMDGGDCDSGSCVNATCRCTSDQECGSKECIGGACRSSCVGNDDCSGPSVCTDALTERLFADFLMFTNATLEERVLIEVLAADDDDADLTGDPPTPHFQEIFDAFVLGHGWPAPNIGGQDDLTITVAWDVGGSPMKGTDYSVYHNASPPYVVLKTTVAAGGDQVTEWRISREDGSGNPLDIGAVYGDWQWRCDLGANHLQPCTTGGDCPGGTCGIAADVTVKVGDGADKCRTLHIVDVRTQSSALPSPDYTKYSGIRLELDSDDENTRADLTGRAVSYANSSGDGGRIDGTVQGNARGIDAQAIGEGETTGGTLVVGGGVANTKFTTFPSGSTLTAGSVAGKVSVRSDLIGTINIEGNLAAKIEVTNSSSSTGDILVNGNIAGDPITGQAIHIEGDMYGDIIANADSTGTGEITGKVTVTGLFQGNICGDNLDAEEAFPSNINILLGREATICGEAPDYTVNDALYVIYVDEEATAGNLDGSKWEDAYTSLQDALDDADTPALAGADLRVFVAQGTYWPSDCYGSCSSTDREATFTLVDGVDYYGGLVGDEHPLDSLANADTHATILSGDLEHNDSGWSNRSDNSYHVVTATDATSDTVFNGFVITGGNANGSSPDNLGGGMYIDDGAPVLRRLMFVSNSAAASGGGLYSIDADLTVDGCAFDNNHAQYGGGQAINGTVSSLDITNCTYVVNFASALGGGIYNMSYGVNIGNSVLVYNYSVDNEYWQTDSEHIDQIHGSVAPTVTNSMVHGGCSGNGNIDIPAGDDQDDIFVDADGADNTIGTADDDLRPVLGSACIDAGDNSVVPVELATDLDGRERFINDTCKVDTGSGGSPIVDMGAYETEDYGCPSVTAASSKKLHGATGYEVPAGEVECRDGGITQVILDFDMRTFSEDANALAAGDFTLSSGTASFVFHLTNQPNDPFLERYIVNMYGVSDDAQFTLEFTAENAQGYETEYELCWTALEGDVNGDGDVDSADETALASASDPVTASNFRADLDRDNNIEGGSSEDDWQVWSDNENDTASVCE